MCQVKNTSEENNSNKNKRLNDKLSNTRATSKLLKKGFASILILISLFATFNIFQLQKARLQLHNSIIINIEKISLGSLMRDSIRLRTISLYKMQRMDDYFDRDEELVKFYGHALRYREARAKTVSLGVTEIEKKINYKIIDQIATAQPITLDAAQSMVSQISSSELKIKVNLAIAGQEKLFDLLNEMTYLQQKQSEDILKDIDENFIYTIFLTLFVTIIVILISIKISTTIYRYVIDSNNLLVQKNIDLETAYNKSEEATKIKSEFLAKMSHEIRTPMNGIMGMLQLLLMEDLNSTQKDYAETALNSNRSLLTIINDILDFSKMEAGKFDIINTSFSLSSVLNRVISTVEIPALEKQLKVNYLIQPNVEEYYLGDESRISQILINLISNAIKFTDKGGININVSLNETNNTSSLLYIETMDTGIGISDEAKKNLFIPFNQADNSISRVYGGTGLGLAICKQLCSLMGGDIGVIDGKNGGSIFWITLNLDRIKDQQNTLDEINNIQNNYIKSTTISKENIYKSKKRILVVEDKDVNQDVAIGILKKLNYSSELAEHGKIAIEKVQLNDYDLILMDCHMPYMDGYEATQKIRLLQKKGEVAYCPIVAVTGNAMHGDKEKCIGAGMDDFLSKPFTVKEVSNIIEKWLKKSLD